MSTVFLPPPYSREQLRSGGIYHIVHLESGREYIGSAEEFNDRWKRHRSQLNCRTHRNKLLERSWHVHGQAAFEFHILEFVVNPDELLIREQWYLDTHKPYYNLSPTAGSNRGYKHSDSMRAKVAKNNARLWADPAYRERTIAAIRLGAKNRKPTQRTTTRVASNAAASARLKEKWKDPAFREQMAQISRERWADPVERQKILDAKRSPEALAKSRLHRRKPPPEHGQRTAERNRELWQSPGYRERLSKSLRIADFIKRYGHEPTDEELAELQATAIARRRARDNARYHRKCAERLAQQQKQQPTKPIQGKLFEED